MDLNNLNCATFSSIENIEISIGIIQKVIHDIPNDASPGPDGIGPLFLKNGGMMVCEALVDILIPSAPWKWVFIGNCTSKLRVSQI